MDPDDPKRISLQDVLEYVSQLTPEEQRQLTHKLNDMFWVRFAEQIGKSDDVTEKVTSLWISLKERVASGNIDEDLRSFSAQTAQFTADRVSKVRDWLEGKTDGDRESQEPFGESPDVHDQLESTYQSLQANLIQIRQAVAQAIATEKQLEMQLVKNREQAKTWESRAYMAVQQNNEELAEQARQRAAQYVDAADQLALEIQRQKVETGKLREGLTEVESDVQKAYTRKQVLIARDKAARASKMAYEILGKANTSDALSAIERMEKKVSDLEAQAAAMRETFAQEFHPGSSERHMTDKQKEFAAAEFQGAQLQQYKSLAPTASKLVDHALIIVDQVSSLVQTMNALTALSSEQVEPRDSISSKTEPTPGAQVRPPLDPDDPDDDCPYLQ